MDQRFWCLLCSLFLAYNLKVLFDDFYSVNYKIVEKGDQLHDEVTKIAACTHPKWIIQNNAEMDKNKIEVDRVMVGAKAFLNLSIAMIENRLGAKNLFSTDQSYIFRDLICLLINESSYNDPSMKNFLILYKVQLFTYSPGKQPFFYEYTYNNYVNNDSLRILKQKVYGPQYLANPKCRSNRGQFLVSKFNCLRSCAFNSPVDFHPPDTDRLFNQSDLIDLKNYPLDLTPGKIHFKGDSNTKIFRRCLEKCPRDDCFSETYNTITLRGNNRMEIHFESFFYKAYYSTTQFWLQLFGLFALFTSTSVTHTVPHLMSLAAKKLKASHQIYFDRFFPKFKLVLFIFSTIFILAQSILMIIDYKFEKSFPNRTAIWKFSSKPFSLFICLPIETLIYNDSAIEEGRNSQILRNLSFEQLEKKTREFKKGVEKIQLLHRNRVKKLSWTLTGKVLFKNSSFNSLSCLSRCFRIELHYKILKYRMMMPVYYFVIHFQTGFREIYLMERHQNFSSGLVNFKGDFFVRKTTEKALLGSRKANCRKMQKEESRRRQIDRCINQKFVEEHPQALPMNSVVDQDDFDSKKINEYKFKEADTTTIEHDCMETYRDRKSCNEVRFEESMKKMGSYSNKTIRLNLKYEDSTNKEIDQSYIKVGLHILNLESVFFRNNVASCLLFLIAVLKRLFRLKWSNGKLDRFLVVSICFFGFIVHSVFVFKGIVDGELVQDGYFKTMHQFALPNVAFCFDLSNLKFDANHRMTGNYLDTLTERLRLGNIVERILYFNRTHYKEFSPESGSSNYSDSDIRISHFYLANVLYCLEFQLNLKFNEEDFFVLLNKFFFIIYFRRSFTEHTMKTYLFYRQSGQKEVSDLLEYVIGPDKRGYQQIYEIVLELIEVDRNDEFENLKDPRRMFYGKRKTEDPNEYLNEMLTKFSGGNFEKLNLTTNEIPLEFADFDKEINNQLFKQLFLQVMNVSDHQYPNSLNSKLIFFNYYSKRIVLNYLTFFQFSILPIGKRVEITNSENVAKLIQDILNSLSLWLSISITDLWAYIEWVFNFIPKLYHLLVAIRANLSLKCFS